MHSIQNNLMKGLVLKVDFEKAFDSVRWDFLLDCLSIQGFGIKWRNWIHAILKTVRSSVLVNGSPSREFAMGKGLRQGDPLSPMLYIQVSEILHVLMEKVKQIGILQGVIIGSDMNISHLQFADDTIFFLHNNKMSIVGIKTVLIIFQLLTGLKVNFNKSCLHVSDQD